MNSAVAEMGLPDIMLTLMVDCEAPQQGNQGRGHTAQLVALRPVSKKSFK